MNVLVKLKPGLKTRYIKFLVRFLIDHLGLKNSRYKLGITEMQKGRRKNAGVTTHEGDMIIVLLKLNVDETALAQTISHEMVHVKQIARGLLRQESINQESSIVWWRGKKYDLTKVPYLKRPWEIQALTLESLLLRTFEEKFTSWAKRNKIKF